MLKIDPDKVIRVEPETRKEDTGAIALLFFPVIIIIKILFELFA